MIKQVAMPEFIQRDDMPNRTWSVLEGAPLRGEAWTEMRAGKMQVPFGNDALSRVIRAHELMHAKVSPSNVPKNVLDSYNALAIIAAEEFRVNMLIKHKNFNVDALCDGSEVLAGTIAAENSDWNALVRFVASSAGTKACADFIRGIKKSEKVHAEEWAKQAKVIEKALKKFDAERVKALGLSGIADVTPYTAYQCGDDWDVEPLPRGFVKYTLKLAEILKNLMRYPSGQPNDVDGDGDDEQNWVSPQEAFSGDAGQFAPVIEKVLQRRRNVNGNLGRKRKPANIGKNPRRINRMLIDPERRIFDAKVKQVGGIVLIDQSGSMQLLQEDVDQIVNLAPGCLIIGYSHINMKNPNLWVIADRGKVADEFPAGGYGNGVDGPAIRFALKRRKKNEAFIWVCDGSVTDGDNDMTYPNLSRECTHLVEKHGIHMVATVNEAFDALKSVAKGAKLGTRVVGPLKAYMKNIA